MTVTLLRLFLLRQRGTLRQLVRSFRQPARLIGATVVLFGFGCLIWSSVQRAGDHATLTRESFAVLGAMIFTMSIAGGFVQQGPRFAPADVDFLFPAPFTPRHLLLWRLLHLWPLTLLSVGVMTIAFGLRLERPWRFVVGMSLLQLTALHLQLLVSVLLTKATDATARRLRGAARVIAPIVLFGALLYVVFAISERGGLPQLIAPAANSSLARIVFFPAAACSDFVYGVTDRATLLALLRLVIGAAGTFVLLLLPEVDFLEESVATTARFAKAIAARRRGGGAIAIELSGGGSGRSLALPAWRGLFGGAGALVWKNLLVLGRSWRLVIPGLLVGLMIVLPGILSMRRQGGGAGGQSVAVGSLLLATIFWSSALGFDLRRELDRLDELRALPLRPSALVFAELLVPWVVGAVLQEALLVGVHYGLAGQAHVGSLAVALPLLMFLAVVIDNLSVFLFAPKGSTSSRGGFGGGSPLQALRPIAWLAAAVPGAALWRCLLGLDVDPRIALAAGTLLDVAIAAGLFVLLVRLYVGRTVDAAE